MKNMESGSLTWIKHKDSDREFVLRQGNEDIATLRWEKSGGSLATGETAGESWTFKRVGFFHPYVSVRGKGGADIARVEIGIGGSGWIYFTDGERYQWMGNLWRSEWEWRTPSGSTLALFRRDFSIDERSGIVEIPAEHLSTIHLPVLVIAGWYLILLLAEDAALAHSVSGRHKPLASS